MTINMNIAGIQIQIISANSFRINKKVKNFLTDHLIQPDLQLTFKERQEITILEKTHRLDAKMQWSQTENRGDDISIYINEEDKKRAEYRLQANGSWNHASIEYGKEQDVISPFLGSLGEILFRNCLLFHQGIVIHAAAIDWKGRGIIFSAPSGTGKTTQANLWRKHKGAKILNADRPAIRVHEHQAYVYGTLWNGSSQKCCNEGIPLSAIILLEQAKDNEIRKLEHGEATSRLIPRCFLPYYQEDIMNIALDNIERLIAKTPVYILRCTPDKAAVELLYQWMK